MLAYKWEHIWWGKTLIPLKYDCTEGQSILRCYCELPQSYSTKSFLPQCFSCIMIKTGCSVHAGVCWGDSTGVCRRRWVDLAVGNVSHLCHFHMKCVSSTHLPLWVNALNDSGTFFRMTLSMQLYICRMFNGFASLLLYCGSVEIGAQGSENTDLKIN